jgi:hypothetical protein
LRSRLNASDSPVVAESDAETASGSDPEHVVLTTTDSNVWGGASGHTYTLTPRPNGTTEVDAPVVREGKNFKGRMLGLFLATIGKRSLERTFERTIKAIEARD